jgi:hypothetical protein
MKLASGVQKQKSKKWIITSATCPCTCTCIFFMSERTVELGVFFFAYALWSKQHGLSNMACAYMNKSSFYICLGKESSVIERPIWKEKTRSKDEPVCGLHLGL